GVASGIRAAAAATRSRVDARRDLGLLLIWVDRRSWLCVALRLFSLVGAVRGRPERVSTSTDSRNDTGAATATARAVAFGSADMMFAHKVMPTPATTATRADHRPVRLWRLSSSSAATPTRISPSTAAGSEEAPHR